MSTSNNTTRKLVAKKIMLTVRLDAEQYNQVIRDASLGGISLNEHCLLMLDVQRDVKKNGKPRGRVPKLRTVTKEPKS